MQDYSIIGRVIDHEHRPVSGLTVTIQHRSEVTRRMHPVGETKTDGEGRFDLQLDPKEAGGLTARLGHAPQLQLVLKDKMGKEILASRTIPIDWQLEYRIYLGGGRKVSEAPDLYEGAAKRMMADTREAKMGDRMKNGKNGDAKGGEAKGGWLKDAVFADPSEDSGESVNMLFAVTDGATMDRVTAPQLQTFEYDGPQVPRRAWQAPDDQVIIWPRRERFRWA